MNRYLLMFVIFFISFQLYSQVDKPDLIEIDSLKSSENNNFELNHFSHITFLDDKRGLRSLYRINNEEGFILQKTVNGGYNWETIFFDTLRYKYFENGHEEISSPRILTYFEYFKNGKIILYCSGGFTTFGLSRNKGCSIITSYDDGNTWEEIKNDTIKSIQFVYLNENPILWVEFSKESKNKPLIYNKYFTSSDKGKSYELINFPDELKNFKYTEISVVDSNSIFISFVDASTNPFLFYPHIYLIREKKFEKYQIPKEFSNGLFLDITFRTLNDATIKINKVINSDTLPQWETYLMRTTDKGETWFTILDMSIFTKYYKKSKLKKCVYFDSLNIIGFGTEYDIVKTSDGGNSWKQLSIKEMTREQWDSIKFTSDNNELATRIAPLVNFDGICWPSLKHCFVYCANWLFSPGILYKIDDSLFGIDQNYFDEHNNFIFPNPVTSSFSISQIHDGALSYEIFDNLGIKVIEGLIEKEIDVSFLPSGIYFLKLNNQAKPLKFMKI